MVIKNVQSLLVAILQTHMTAAGFVLFYGKRKEMPPEQIT